MVTIRTKLQVAALWISDKGIFLRHAEEVASAIVGCTLMPEEKRPIW